MKKGITAVVLVLALLFSTGCGKDTDEGTPPTEGSPGSSVSAGNDVEGEDIPSDGSEEKYLDEATGIYHTAHGVSFSLPDDWAVGGDALGAGGACGIGPKDGTCSVAIYVYNSDESAQVKYDMDNENGFLGESHEVTYGNNTYISNIEPAGDSGTYFYYMGKSDPIVYCVTPIDDIDKVGLEEVLSTLSF